MHAIIIGATEATGKPLTQLLLNHLAFDKVTVFVRRPLDLSHPKLTVEIIDFENPDTWQNKVTGDVLFSCLGTTLKQAGAVKTHNIKLIILINIILPKSPNKMALNIMS